MRLKKLVIAGLGRVRGARVDAGAATVDLARPQVHEFERLRWYAAGVHRLENVLDAGRDVRLACGVLDACCHFSSAQIVDYRTALRRPAVAGGNVGPAVTSPARDASW